MKRKASRVAGWLFVLQLIVQTPIIYVTTGDFVLTIVVPKTDIGIPVL